MLKTGSAGDLPFAFVQSDLEVFFVIGDLGMEEFVLWQITARYPAELSHVWSTHLDHSLEPTAQSSSVSDVSGKGDDLISLIIFRISQFSPLGCQPLVPLQRNLLVWWREAGGGDGRCED